MRQGDSQVGIPETIYKDTKANIEAIASPVAGMVAYATDTGLFGVYDGVTSAWVWGGGGSGITVVTSDPISPADDEMWVLKTVTTSGQAAGNAMGVMGLTYSGIVTIATYKLKIYNTTILHKYSVELVQE